MYNIDDSTTIRAVRHVSALPLYACFNVFRPIIIFKKTLRVIKQAITICDLGNFYRY